ncbi:DUF7373 family lipoprotein [Nocardia farcinica]|uniref:DUF7373 family lipoprotein n=1 Tax=Nocardia farcinica TaxID=37329 RepID=UPI0015F05502|nr:hypothetical protein [Nocardia farcinica]MBA4857707.1 hypothetical protein [Nocardia farcinica]MBC9817417.1 hypothetical protein [Nocardia farcinica]MBF6069443.1 hypothetical protein [Nocardia farcinica]MBF6251545.1 hypothetical protein [Nocardia farcinica]MBF6292292.1 hypothetical protein [Nocardia farcinica]
MRLLGIGLPVCAVATVLALTSCSATLSGTAQPGLMPVDVASLQTGPYVPEPTSYDPEISTIDELRLVESRRLLGYLVSPSEIDTEISVSGPLALFSGPDSMIGEKTFPEKYKPAAADNNLLLGVYVSRVNGDLRNRKKLIISVLRFPTAEASRKAVEQFDHITNSEPGRHPIPVAGRPDARASSADDVTAIGFAAHGPYVIVANAGVPQPNPTALADVIGRTFDAQTARLDETTPTPLDDVLDQPLDPDSIMRRALPTAPDYSDPFFGETDFGAYSADGAIHFERDPVEMTKAFDAAGVDLVARRGGILYRASDLAGAFRIQTALLKGGKNDEELPAPPGLPDARCMKLERPDETRNFDLFCAVVFGRYVGVVVAKSMLSGRLDPVLYQRAAAQYAILAKSE